MASVPNMRGFQLAPPPATPAPADGEFGRQFPALAPAPVVSAVPAVPAVPGEAIAGAPPVADVDLGPVTIPLSTQPAETPRLLPAPEADGEAPVAAEAPDADGKDKPAPDPAAPAAPIDLIPVVQAQICLPVWVVTVADAPLVPATTQPVEEPLRPAVPPGAEVIEATPATPSANNEAPVPAPALPDAPAKASVKAPTAKAPRPEAPDKPADAPVVAAPPAPLPAQVLTSLIAALDPAPAPVPPAPAERGPSVAAQPADQMVERELDLARDGEWLDRLARDIARAGGNDGGPIRFRLHPASLGHLRVELAQGDHGTSIRLTVETEQARAILADAQPRLLAEARAQGVRVAQAEVDLGSGRQQDGSQDPRRNADGSPAQLIRTARGGRRDTVAVDRPQRRSERYA